MPGDIQIAVAVFIETMTTMESKVRANVCSELLDKMKVENSLVVVSRWYGGILMGGARWVAINR